MFDYGNPYGMYGIGANFQPQQRFMPQMMNQQGFMQNTPQQPQNSTPAVMQVSTVKQVDQVQVQPGGKALVMVANEPVIAMRMADNMGLTTTDYYHISKFDPESTPEAQTVDFVPRDEFTQTIQTLAQEIQKLQQAAPVKDPEEAKKGVSE